MSTLTQDIAAAEQSASTARVSVREAEKRLVDARTLAAAVPTGPESRHLNARVVDAERELQSARDDYDAAEAHESNLEASE
jgi:predicted  nucleic acid-binding Zn-ribbon protein